MIFYNYYIAIFILALIFFILSTKNISILLTIIIIIIIGYYYFTQIYIFDEKQITNFNNKIKLITNDIKDRENFNDENYIFKIFPFVIRYLRHDDFLIELILNIRFLKVFDNAKYTNIIASLEKFMKIYIFMLGDRYDINLYFSTFLLLRNSIIKELYSTYVILPNKFIYIFKINPFDEIKKAIYNFIKHSRKMIITIQNYAYNNKNIKYLEDTKYKPYQKNNFLEIY
jgi:hypothetical protein